MARCDLDELFHGPGWAPTPTRDFRERVTAALEDAESGSAGWVVAGNYATVSDITHGAADTIIWLDLARWRTVSRVARRGALRVVRREELWNGNRELLRDLLSRDPDRNIIVAAWQLHPLYRSRYSDHATSRFWAHADVHRLRHPSEARELLASMTPA